MYHAMIRVIDAAMSISPEVKSGAITDISGRANADIRPASTTVAIPVATRIALVAPVRSHARSRVAQAAKVGTSTWLATTMAIAVTASGSRRATTQASDLAPIAPMTPTADRSSSRPLSTPSMATIEVMPLCRTTAFGAFSAASEPRAGVVGALMSMPSAHLEVGSRGVQAGA